MTVNGRDSDERGEMAVRGAQKKDGAKNSRG